MNAQTMPLAPRVAGMEAASFPSARHARGAARPSLWARLFSWIKVARERRRLLELDPRLLKDVGLTPEQAWHEASRPFWDVDRSR